MTLHLHHPPLFHCIERSAAISAVIAAATVFAVVFLSGCATPPANTMSPQVQKVFDVTCGVDAHLQPIVVPVAVAVAAPTPAGLPVAAGAALDTALLHPAIVAACAVYGTKPVAVALDPVQPPSAP
jgi:hypothetical protein